MALRQPAHFQGHLVLLLLAVGLLAAHLPKLASALPCGDESRQKCERCVELSDDVHRCYWVQLSESCVPEKDVLEPASSDVAPGGNCAGEGTAKGIAKGIAKGTFKIKSIPLPKTKSLPQEDIIPERNEIVLARPRSQEVLHQEEQVGLLEALPLEVLQIIFRKVCIKDLASVMLTCKYLHRAGSDLLSRNVFPARELCAGNVHIAMTSSHSSHSDVDYAMFHVDNFRKYQVEGEQHHMVHLSFGVQFDPLSMTMDFSTDMRPEFERIFSASDQQALKRLGSHVQELQSSSKMPLSELYSNLVGSGPGIVMVNGQESSRNNNVVLALVPGYIKQITIELSPNWGSEKIPHNPNLFENYFSSSNEKPFTEKGEKGAVIITVKRYLKYMYKPGGRDKELCAIVFVQNEVVHMYLTFGCINSLICPGKKDTDK